MIAHNGGLTDDWAECERQRQRWHQAQLDQQRWDRYYERMMAEFAAEAEAAAAKLAQARYESQQAFRRPPRKCGLGKPPPKKWDATKPRRRRRRRQRR